MENPKQGRAVPVVIGALAGLALWLVDMPALQAALTERMQFLLGSLVVVFFGLLLALTGPLRAGRAIAAALPLAVGVALMLLMASMRHETVAAFHFSDLAFVAAFVLAVLPLPFVIAAAGPGWRDYGAVFGEGWLLVMRGSLAWILAGLVWGVIWIADALMGLVGLGVMKQLLAQGGPLPGMVTGAALGLGVALAVEHEDLLSPEPVLRALRWLVLPLLAVMLAFFLALPVQGLSGLPAGLSAAVILLGLSAAAVLLATLTVGTDEEEAAGMGRWLVLGGQGLAAILPLPVALAAWSVWLRVAQHGWTPGRVFVAGLVLLAAGHAALYLLALLQGGLRGAAAWRGGLRRANMVMAGAAMAAAALWLSPLLNAEAISARSQVLRFEAGEVAAADLDLAALERWGLPGRAALARLEVLAQDAGQADLAARLEARQGERAGSADPQTAAQEAEAMLAQLRAILPVQPAGATAGRDRLLAGIGAQELQAWVDACRTPLPGQAERPGCVMLLADFLPDLPGEEALVLLRGPEGFMRYEGLALQGGAVQRRSVAAMTGMLADREAGAALIASLQEGVPGLQPAPVNMLDMAGGVLLLP